MKLSSVFFALLFMVSSCGSKDLVTSDSIDKSTRSESSDSVGGDRPKVVREPSKTCPTFDYPVTLYGAVHATTSDVKTAEYYILNGELKVFLKVTPTTEPETIRHLNMLTGIFKYGGADGCVSGLSLPTNVNGRLEFNIEVGAIAIEAGGFSVSN